MKRKTMIQNTKYLNKEQIMAFSFFYSGARQTTGPNKDVNKSKTYYS